jgi:glycerophosphoryl diester phosphodiesterase
MAKQCLLDTNMTNTRRVFALLLTIVLAGCASRFDVQGHRGARGLLPENTLPAFERALALGVDTLELDIGVTQDGVVVIYHDRTLNADITRDETGSFLTARGPAISSLTFAQLQRYDVGRIAPASAYAKTFSKQTARDGTRVPRLVDLFEMVKNTKIVPTPQVVRFNIETKLSPLAPNETVSPEIMTRALVAEIDRANLRSRVSIQSFDWRTLQLVQQTAPGIETVYLTNEQGANETVRRGQPGASPWFAGFDVDAHEGSLPATVKAAGGRVWSPNFRDLTQATLAQAKQLGVRVIPWTVNEVDDMRRMMAWGVDGIITDYPDVLIALRNGAKP